MTKMSSRGQIVIPQDMRKDFREGEQIFVIKSKGKIILRNKEGLEDNFAEDLEFAKRTEEALARIEAGEFVAVDSENLIDEMSKW